MTSFYFLRIAGFGVTHSGKSGFKCEVAYIIHINILQECFFTSWTL